MSKLLAVIFFSEFRRCCTTRQTLQWAALFIFGIVILAYAWRSYPVCILMFGRVFVSLGVGFGLAVCLLFGFVNCDCFGNNTNAVAAILSCCLEYRLIRCTLPKESCGTPRVELVTWYKMTIKAVVGSAFFYIFPTVNKGTITGTRVLALCRNFQGGNRPVLEASGIADSTRTSAGLLRSRCDRVQLQEQNQ